MQTVCPCFTSYKRICFTKCLYFLNFINVYNFAASLVIDHRQKLKSITLGGLQWHNLHIKFRENIVTCLLKAGIAELEETAVARQCLGKHASTETKHAQKVELL
jgi:hypothetical protein